jgi:acyl-lipid omega-6 desaturase (Delta-12 desaturase)
MSKQIEAAPEISSHPQQIEEKSWQASLAPYRTPTLGASLWQMANTFIPLLGICYLMYLSLGYSYWLTLALAPVAAGFHVRLFIIFHDCTHNAFFKSQKANAVLGSILGVFSLTPYYHWRHYHAIHHATTGNLTKRVEGQVLPLTIQKCFETNGDVLTITVKEYLQLTKKQRLVYRVYRWMLLLVVVMPLVVFVVSHRFANPKVAKRERHSVYWTNLALFGLVALAVFTIGLGPLLLIAIPVIGLSSTIGVWLFYMQHQFEETYWEEQAEWKFFTAALQGSSYYKLPKVLQWFTGNIGFHHIHHLNPRIPNYNLQKCHESNALFQKVKPVTLLESLRSVFFRLWDEEQKKMVSFRKVRE